MEKVSGRLTVFFEDPFWVGVFERTERGRLSACRALFGAQPGDQKTAAVRKEAAEKEGET